MTRPCPLAMIAPCREPHSKLESSQCRRAGDAVARLGRKDQREHGGVRLPLTAVGLGRAVGRSQLRLTRSRLRLSSLSFLLLPFSLSLCLSAASRHDAIPMSLHSTAPVQSVNQTKAVTLGEANAKNRMPPPPPPPPAGMPKPSLVSVDPGASKESMKAELERKREKVRRRAQRGEREKDEGRRGWHCRQETRFSAGKRSEEKRRGLPQGKGCALSDT